MRTNLRSLTACVGFIGLTHALDSSCRMVPAVPCSEHLSLKAQQKQPQYYRGSQDHCDGTEQRKPLLQGSGKELVGSIVFHASMYRHKHLPLDMIAGQVSGPNKEPNTSPCMHHSRLWQQCSKRRRQVVLSCELGRVCQHDVNRGSSGPSTSHLLLLHDA